MIHTKFSYIVRCLCCMAFMAITAVFVVGCSDDSMEVVIPEESECGYITISLNCLNNSRAPEDEAYTEDGDDGLHENLISTATLCLWSKGGENSEDTAKPDYVVTFTVNKTNKATLRVPLTQALINKLFQPTPGICNAFVAVNVTKPEGEFTIADFRNMAIRSHFASQRVQASFAMDGDCEVSYDPTTLKASGSISLRRSASKLTLALSVDPEVEQSVVVGGNLVTDKWVPDTKNMKVKLVGGLRSSTLDPNLDVNPAQEEFFETADNLPYMFTDNKKGENGSPDNGNNPGEYNYAFIQEYPFYSYPHRWSAEPGDYATTYMLLEIPWRRIIGKDDNDNNIYDDTWRTCYYQVPAIAADSEVLQLVRNVSYHVYLHVGLLGSFIPDEPMELPDMKYSAAEWGNVNMDVTIPDVRYLVVDQNDYTVNNETSIAIPFYTSHETIVTDATMTFYRYNFDDVGRELPVTVSMKQNHQSYLSATDSVFVAWFNNETKELIVSHDLVMYEGCTSNGSVVSFTNNDGPQITNRPPLTDNKWKTDVLDKISYFKKQESTALIPDVDEYSRVEYKITVQHIDMQGTPNFKEDITITQYPGMYITTVQNYCPIDSDIRSWTGAQGNTIINNSYYNYSPFSPATVEDGRTASDHRPSINLPSGWMTSIGLSFGNYNYNPNMYLVTVTTLPIGTPYKIGDPRSNVINNNLASKNRNETPTNLLGRNPGDNNFYGYSYSQTTQKNYARALITTGVNNTLETGENRTTWTGSTYSWYYWSEGTTSSVGSNPYYINRNYSGSVTCKGFANAPDISTNTQRSLSYYYPTLEDDAHKMMIAPKFRICSSYGGTTWQLNRELARRRAASYQEMGFPAGRWRLPTFGEVSFVMNLSAQYKIPRLFGSSDYTWWYWCAQGLVCVPSKKSGNSKATLPTDGEFELPTLILGARDCQRSRFVYDEWYWGEADLKASGPIGSATPVYTFTWGDKPF